MDSEVEDPVAAPPTAEQEIAQAPDAEGSPRPPKIIPVFRHFVAYTVDLPKGRMFFNQFLNLPGPLDNAKAVRLVEEQLGKHIERQQVDQHMRVIGRAPRTTIISMNFIGTFGVEETTTPEGEAADAANAESAEGDAGQHEES